MSQIITISNAVDIMVKELNFTQARATAFVKKFDHNQDGKLDATEFAEFKANFNETKTKLKTKFSEFDRDGNGYVTLVEASNILSKEPFNFPPGKQTALLQQFDRDGNGVLDIEEFAGFYAEATATNDEISARFAELDADKNGLLSPDEVVSILRQTLKLDDENARRMIQMFDTNKDGNLDKTEFMELWGSMFGHK